MDDRRDRTGERLGPYQLDKRYEDLDEPGGELYAAHHVETGRPALVLVPGPEERWAPRGDWSASLVSQSDPPFLATHLDRPPPPDAQALTELELAFIRMAGGVSSVEEREDANADFNSPLRPWTHGRRGGEGSVWTRVRTGALVVGTLLMLAVVLWPRRSSNPEGGMGAINDEQYEPMTWIDEQDGGSTVGYPMPEVAFADQKKPPCGKQIYVEIRGGCWGELKQGAPCGDAFAEYEGKCYVPVRVKKPVPSSIEH